MTYNLFLRSLLASSAIIATAPALAQESVAPQTVQDAGSGNLEEIIVTAQRRSESQQNVPIAISTVSGDAARRMGLTGTESLGVAVPSLQFSRQTGNGGAPFVRGVGSTQASVGSESPVAVYVDDVYVGAPSATLLQFSNIESIAVLKGPQGTLFGRNATGGVVQIQTKRPSHDASLDATAGYGNFDTVSGSVYATGGLSDTIAVNFSVAGQKQGDGYGRSIATGEDVYKSWNYGFRGQLLWEPSDATDLLLSAEYSRNRGDIGMSVIPLPGTLAAGGATNIGRYVTYASPGDFASNKVYGFSGKLQHDFGWAKFVSISAYRRATQLFQLDADGSLPGNPVLIQTNLHNFTKTFSQELQLLSPSDGPFNWIVGAFYYRASAGFDPFITAGASPAFAPVGGSLTVRDRQLLNSYSGFGEISYEFLPRTKITLGLRYTSDKFDFDARRFNAAGTALPPIPIDLSDTFSKLTYRAILDHKLTDDVLLYASYSRGFKSGGYNLSAPTVTVAGVTTIAPPVSPEVLDAYEVGFKADLFDRKVRLNAAAFHYDYSNLQVTSIVNSAAVTSNAARARMNGVDLDLTVAPSRRLTFTASASFLDAKYTRFPAGPLNVPNPATCVPPATTGPLTGGNRVCVTDLSGNRTSRAPKFTGTIGATYTLPTEAGDFILNATLNHNSGFFWEADNRFAQPSYDLLNAALTWISPDKSYELKIYGKNLFNEFYYTYLSESTGRDSYSPDMPRNYGVSATIHF